MNDPEEILARQISSAIRPERPDSRFEEDLLLRLSDEFERVQTISEVVHDNPVVELEAIQEVSTHGPSGRGRNIWPRTLLAIAAVAALALGGWRLGASPDPSTRIGATDIEEPIERIDAACRELFGSVSTAFGSTGAGIALPQEALPNVAKQFVTAISNSIGDEPGFDDERAQIDQARIDLATGQSLVAMPLTNGEDPSDQYTIRVPRRMLSVLDGFVDQGAEECATMGWLGIKFISLQDGEAEVDALVPGSPADSAGIEPGDKLRSVNGSMTTTAGDLLETLLELEPDVDVTVTVLRDGEEQELRLTLGARQRDS